WRTLRPRSGKTHVSDGPYTESKEVVGGLFIIEADSRDEALRIASMHPAATLGEEGGWAVELIPMDFYLAR
ncbi:MAG: YciI family protein, partial [Rhodanobacter sp.]